MQKDSSDAVIAEFMDALQRGYDGKVEDLDRVSTIGRNIGYAIKASEKTGLADNDKWTLNEKMFFQGLVNGIYGDTVMMSADEARTFFQEQYAASIKDSLMKAGKPIKSSCPKEMKTLVLKTNSDSLNYAFGVLNGSEIKMYVLAEDSTGEDTKIFFAELNKAMKTKVRNHQMVSMAEQIGKTIKEQEPSLLGEEKLTADFQLIKQGFINGLNKYETAFTRETAGEYVQNTMDNIKYGESKIANEEFLETNRLKEGVHVTESGLQYEVLKQGKGAMPKATDKVKVHYHGTLIDGTVFDSSVDRGEPAEFGLNQVIPGWTEGLQLMNVGSKYKFYIPQELGYGKNNAGSIPPFSTLIFEVELLDIVK
jgi:FKBP-type peptidyl-prolyl cis-trans isomerase FklB